MAVARREKNADTKYMAAIGTRPPLTDNDSGSEGREPDVLDVIEDLRDDMNAMCDLSATNENKTGISSTQASRITDNATEVAKIAPFTFTFSAGTRGGRASLIIRHTSSGTNFTISA
jgi:hypothetical protein